MPKNILLGISGCISAYKMPEYVRFFIKKGYEVKVILTSCAQKFVTETTLATLSRNPVYIDIFAPENGWMPQHIALAQWADVFLCAPLSADMLSKVASGFSNDLLLATLLAYEGSVVLCPSMNDVMYKNEVIQSHLNSLKKIDRYSFIEPVKGDLACLSHGIGRLPSVQNIYEKIILL